MSVTKNRNGIKNDNGSKKCKVKNARNVKKQRAKSDIKKALQIAMKGNKQHPESDCHLYGKSGSDC